MTRDAATAVPSPGFDRLGRKLLATLALGVLACVGLVLYSDAHKVAGRLADFSLVLLLPILGLSLCNYTLRFLRWQLYLKRLAVVLPWGRSLAVYLVGFLLSVTPGKAGELGKAWLIRELGGGPALRVVPAVLAERVSDLLGVVVLFSLEALTIPGGRLLAACGLAAVAGAGILLTWERGADAVFRGLGRLPWVG
ncbi:MAG TPA: lysylphosphatidylglycerol synthase domain-containing protein, partial [Thermoanaerobaculia bacterium]|nr:lysylphosphatidylglycerol synthase domain-containing protein [Thermoanaerobaculia bacterium]